MLKVEFGYNTKGRFPRIEKKLRWRVDLPQSFSDLTERDLLFLASHYPFTLDLKFQIAFLVHLCNFKKRPVFGLIAFIFLRSEINTLVDVLFPNTGNPEESVFQWLRDDPESERVIINQLYVDGDTYITFQEGLRNISIKELSEAEKYFEMIVAQNNWDALDNLIAVLFKPHGTTFDVKVAYDRAVLFSKLPRPLLTAIFLQYRAQRNFMIHSNKNAFSKAGKSGSTHNTWADIIKDLSVEFVNVQEVEERRAWEVFSWMAHSKKRARELKAKLKAK
jgi:hypothetical protein